LIEQPLAAAIGASIPVSAPSGSMVLDIGAGSSESAVISLGGIVVHKSVRIAGIKLDEAIQEYVKKKYNIIIGDQTAEDVKIQIGSAIKLSKEEKLEVSGRDVVFGLPKSVYVTSTDVCSAINLPLMQIIEAVRGVLENTPPELASDIIDKGIVMTGGITQLRNIDRLLTEETGVPSHVAEEPEYCVIRGAGVVLENIDLWKRSIASVR
jgi:rod shape-determining protein MreB